ncbi:insulin-like growth factor binding protein [Anaeramoeba flamelloides]|uniref:Insulin-like growth factor binding protein n=1 Tax=Anaeramoeba flamelloides TaxID=1746091 RepID=A0ABQ8ZA23_9EUKA|nr:insulin-like growth factor binding protein [Anaeramoeba flamelloides]
MNKFVIFLVVLLATLSFQTNPQLSTRKVPVLGYSCKIYVNAATGNDGNDCKAANRACQTINKGVDKADGKTVCVSPGTYYLSKTINMGSVDVLYALEGPGSTIIDGKDERLCVYSKHKGRTIDGFTIQNCRGNEGGGMYFYCWSAITYFPQVKNCIFRNNYAKKGGAVYNGMCCPRFTNVTMINNYASQTGGGFYCEMNAAYSHPDVRFTDMKIADNQSPGVMNVRNQPPSQGGGYSCKVNKNKLYDCGSCWNGGNCQPDGNCVCQPGSSSPSPECPFCEVGSYSEGENVDACTKCAKGTYNRHTGSSTVDACLSCPTGSYNDDLGQTTCTECDVGHYNPNEGSTTEDACEMCPLGTYNSVTGRSECDICQSGTYNDDLGQTTCTECDVGHYNPNEGSTTEDACEMCPLGTYNSATGRSECTICPMGTYADQLGMSSCSWCPRGTYNENTGSTNSSDCIKCPAGTFNEAYPSTSHEECDSCAVGFMNNQTGSDSEASCVACPKGYFSNETASTFCYVCVAGTFNSKLNNTHCTKCPKGTFNDEEGADDSDKCELCPIGRYSDISGLTRCTKCPKGTFEDSLGSKFCQRCEGGTYNNRTGSFNATDCLDCAIGSHSPKKGSEVCLPCSLGSYANETGLSFCYECPQGTYSNTATFTDNCKECQPGMYTDETGSSYCKECAAGTYNPNYRSSMCHICANGTFSQYNKSTECKSCDPGSYSNFEMGLSQCELCLPGTYQQHTKSTSCLQCPVGTYSDKYGRTICSSCASGTFQSTKGKASCEICNYGSYQENAGSSRCENCPLHSTTLIHKSTDPQLCYCNIGYYGAMGGPCFECPVGSICNKMNLEFPYAEYGFWHTEDDPHTYIKCNPEESCTGGVFDQCNTEKGYIGDVCTKCDEGFYRFENKCSKCPTGFNWMLFCAILVVFMLLIGLFTLARRLNEYFGSIAITFSFLQILSIMYNLKVDWPDSLQKTFNIALAFNLSFDFLGVECNIKLDYIDKMLLYLFTPLIFLVMLLIIYGITIVHSKFVERYGQRILDRAPYLAVQPSRKQNNAAMYALKSLFSIITKPLTNGFSNEERKGLTKNFINSYTLLLSFLYLVLSIKILEFFSCEKNEDQVWRMSQYPSIVCYESWYYKHLIWVLFFAIIYLPGIPILLVCLMVRYSKKLNEDDFDSLFGLISYRYSKTWFFWEIVVMMRKLLMVIIRIFLRNSPAMQVILCIIIILIALLLQAKIKPYLVKRHNHLEFYLLLISEAVLFSGLIFQSNDFEQNSKQSIMLASAVVGMIVLGAVVTVLIVISEIRHRLNVKEGKDKDEIKYENEILKGNAISIFFKNKKPIWGYLGWIKELSGNRSKKSLQLLKILQKSTYKNSIKTPRDNLVSVWERDLVYIFCNWYKGKATIVQKINITKMFQKFFNYQMSSGLYRKKTMVQKLIPIKRTQDANN